MRNVFIRFKAHACGINIFIDDVIGCFVCVLLTSF